MNLLIIRLKPQIADKNSSRTLACHCFYALFSLNNIFKALTIFTYVMKFDAHELSLL